MSVPEKIKTINKKVEKSKSQHNLDIQTPKISALLPGNHKKYESLTDKYVLPEKVLLKKLIQSRTDR